MEEIKYGTETLIVTEVKKGISFTERFYTPIGFLYFLYEVANGNIELEVDSVYVVKSRIYEENEGTPPSILYGDIKKLNGKWVFTLEG